MSSGGRRYPWEVAEGMRRSLLHFGFLLACLAVVLVLASCVVPSPPVPPTPTRNPSPTTSPPKTTATPSPPPTSKTVAPTTKTAPSPSTPATPHSPSIKLESVGDTASKAGEKITCLFEWKHKGCSWWYEATLSNSLYQYYRERPRIQVEDWAVYPTHPGNDWLTKGLAEVIQRDAPKLGYQPYDIVECAVVFAQSIPYTLDADSKGKSEYPRFPIETVVERTGDCEDHAILLAAVTRALGYDTILLNFPTHIAVGIAGDPSIRGTYYEHRGKQFYYVETTSTGWKIGQVPEKFRGVSAKVIELTPKPVFYCRWSYPSWQGYIPVNVTVENRGSLAADGVVVHAGCDAGSDKVWNQMKTSSFSIPVDQKATVQLSLVPPRGQHTRVVVWVTEGDRTVHKSYSDQWFDTK